MGTHTLREAAIKYFCCRTSKTRDVGGGFGWVHYTLLINYFEFFTRKKMLFCYSYLPEQFYWYDHLKKIAAFLSYHSLKNLFVCTKLCLAVAHAAVPSLTPKGNPALAEIQSLKSL